MSQPSEKAPRVPDLGRFGMGEWEVNQAENALFSEGRCVRVEPRVMDVLVYLAAESGRVVSKDAPDGGMEWRVRRGGSADPSGSQPQESLGG